MHNIKRRADNVGTRFFSKELISLYSFDQNLLTNIYLENSLYSEHFDYHGEFLIEILKEHPNFIDEYLSIKTLTIC